MKNITYAISLWFLLCSLTGFSQSTATYTITFSSEWNASDHGILPNNAHWSKLVGVNHNNSVSFWKVSNMASLGIEDLSEIGDNTAFNNEITTSISQGHSQQYIDGNNLGNATGTIVINDLEISENFPLITLASMIAPSPDWFIGIHDVSLLDTDGNWIPFITMDMFVHDAGTEEGDTYSYDYPATSPQGIITSKSGVVPFNNQRVGTLNITLESLLNTDTVSHLNKIQLYPNPSTGITTISTAKTTAIASINITTFLGKSVYKNTYEATNNVIRLDLNHLTQGLYLIQITTKKGNTDTKRLLIK